MFIEGSDFLFENGWLREMDISDVVNSSWSKIERGELMDRLGLCFSKLSTWGKSLHKTIRKEIRDCNSLMTELRGKNDQNLVQLYEATHKKLAKLLVRENDYRRQKAKSYWLQDGDLNTRYSNTYATACMKAKRIQKLYDSDGILHETK